MSAGPMASARPMRWRVNPFRTPAPPPVADRAVIRAFHRGLAGYQPTPLHLLPGLAASLGVGRILVKDEGGRFGLKAFKALGAAWAIERLRRQGVSLRTVSSATDGNHGRAVAWAARQLGLEAVIYLTAHSSPARIEAIRGEGARVVLVDGTYDDAVRRCADESVSAGWQVVADVGYPGYLEIPQWITDGYGTLLEEVDEARTARALPDPDLVMVQAGVGGFAAAVVEHYRRTGRDPAIVIVEPVEADPLLESALTADGRPAPSAGSQHSLMACLNCGTVSLTAWPSLRAGAAAFLTVSDEWAVAAIRRFAAPAAGDPVVVAGESGAAGLAGLLALLGEPRFEGLRQALPLGPGSTVLLFVTEADTDPDAWRRIVAGLPSGRATGTVPAPAPRPGPGH